MLLALFGCNVTGKELATVAAGGAAAAAAAAANTTTTSSVLFISPLFHQ